MYHNARYSVNVKKVRKGWRNWTICSFSKRFTKHYIKFTFHFVFILYLLFSIWNTSLHQESYKDPIKGKSPEIHLTSSEVRAGSMIESSLLYEHPSRIVEEKCANQVSNFYVGKISVLNIKTVKSIKFKNAYIFPWIVSFRWLILTRMWLIFRGLQQLRQTRLRIIMMRGAVIVVLMIQEGDPLELTYEIPRRNASYKMEQYIS